MIYGIWHPGSGIGDQLFCYLAARITAERLGTDFAMAGAFKGASFIDLDRGTNEPINHHIEWPAGKLIIDNNWPIYEGKTYYDPEFYFIEDNTIVDGCRIQDERYFEGWPIGEWFAHDEYIGPYERCVINFRGGEFAAIPELFLPKSYWEKAMAIMREQGFTEFQVHTDDPNTAQKFFPEFEIIHNVRRNWLNVRAARGAIIANSAFGIIPRLLRHQEKNGFSPITIAPRRWARRNLGAEWSTPQNFYKQFLYI